MRKKAMQFILFWLFLAAGAHAQLTPFEDTFGPTNIYGMSGNGGLTLGFSKDGVVTVFRWPSPSFYDQLFYRTKPKARFKPRMGAHRFSGLQFAKYQKERKDIQFLREISLGSAYEEDIGSIFVTRYKDGSVSRIFVVPEQDVAVFELTKESEGIPLFYENFAPTLKKMKGLPVADWVQDEKNDFALFGPDQDGVLFRFLPEGNKRIWEKKLKKAWQNRKDQGIEEALKKTKGVFIAMASSPEPEKLFSGPFDAEKDRSLAVDRFLAGGTTGLRFQTGQLSSLWVFSENTSSMVIYVALAETMLQAKKAVLSAKKRAFTELRREHREHWREVLSRARLPKRLNARRRAFVLRALQTVFLSMDRQTGAIVASISTQPPYNLDWPRDGAFINLFLDWAGFPELVTKHNFFYLRVQRKKGPPTSPPGSFAMNFYADGMVGGPIPFEIDETGLVLWSFAEHARYLSAPEKKRYLQKVYPGIKLAADALVECKDQTNNLQCYANEDDHPERTQGPQGAITVWLGLKAASKAAKLLGHKQDKRRWEARARELKEAILKNFYDQKKGYFPIGTGSSSWLIYPAKFLPAEDPRIQRQAEYLYQKVYDALFHKKGSMYDAKVTLALAMIWKDKEKKEKLEKLVKVLAEDVPTDGTLHVGEVYARLGEEDWLNIQSPPHVWNASLIALTLYALNPPEDLSALFNQSL